MDRFGQTRWRWIVVMGILAVGSRVDSGVKVLRLVQLSRTVTLFRAYSQLAHRLEIGFHLDLT
jgi:hypothetical protein